MSRVFVAEEIRFRRKVVVKVLTPELAAGVSADRFERELIHQRGRRTLEESMEAGWGVLRRLPKAELARLSDTQIARHVAAGTGGERHA